MLRAIGSLLLRDLGTGRTNTKKINFVVFYHISFRCSFSFVEGASREFVGAVANAAVEVVMVSFTGSFV